MDHMYQKLMVKIADEKRQQESSTKEGDRINIYEANTIYIFT